MNVERLAEEYIKRKKLLDDLAKQVDDLKKMLNKAIEEDGETDEKGHRWLTAGDYLLQRQKRQGQKSLDMAAVEEWATERGIYDAITTTTTVIDQDRLVGYVYEHRKDDPSIEDEFESLYKEAPVTYAFLPPVVGKQYDY